MEFELQKQILYLENLGSLPHIPDLTSTIPDGSIGYAMTSNFQNSWNDSSYCSTPDLNSCNANLFYLKDDGHSLQNLRTCSPGGRDIGIHGHFVLSHHGNLDAWKCRLGNHKQTTRYHGNYTAVDNQGQADLLEGHSSDMAQSHIDARQGRIEVKQGRTEVKWKVAPSAKSGGYSEKRTEIEAVEACKWLRAAGFPQYAQMYEDQLFPIDITSVEKDHDFLDTDSIQSLFRRLNTLNKCANMKIEAPPRKSGDESDEEEQCALSDRWRFQRSSRRWSRRDLDDLLPTVGDQLLPPGQHPDDSLDKSGLRSCSSHDSVLTDTEPSLTHLDDSPLLHHRTTNRHGSVPDSPSYAGGTTLLVPPPGSTSTEKSERRSMSPISPRLRRAASERFRGAKIFLKRIESFKTKKSKKKPSINSGGSSSSGGRMEISGPVVTDSSGLQERIDQLGCVDISPTNEKPPSSSPFSDEKSASLGASRQRSPADLSPNSHLGPYSHSMTLSTTDPANQHLLLCKQASASLVAAGSGSSPVNNKRNGRVFLDSSSSFQSGSSTLSDAHSEDPLQTLENMTHQGAPPATACSTPASRNGHRRNHSSSDINLYSGNKKADDQQTKQGSYPMLVSNGFIEVGNGSQVNYRTGSFNMGSERSEDYKDGVIRRTTRRAISDSGCSPQHQEAEAQHKQQQQQQSQQQHNRLSVYDNVPTSEENANAQHELDMILHDLFENINGLSQSLGQCLQDEKSGTDSEVRDTNTAVDTTTNTTVTTAAVSSDDDQYDVAMSPAIPGLHDDNPIITTTATTTSLVSSEETSPHIPHYHQRAPPPVQVPPGGEDPDLASASSSTHEMSDADTAGSREEDGSDQPESTRERRDSGVGSSLTRAPSDRRRHRIRWHSFVKSHRPSLTSRSLQISNMSAGQLMVLRKLSLLKVTALMEKYSPTNRSGWNWIMPKFIKRFKVPDYKDKQVFGVPLLVVLQRTGQPLPQCILYAMRSLRRTARDAVGIFRKSGVRSRIQKLHNQIESNPECMDFDQLQAYDVADLLKQYFRELPECLLTNKLSETFIASFTHVPTELRLDSLQAAVMLLPDENREVLQSLLLFLSDMAEHASENQMTASNLAVCFAPSLFHMCGPRNNPAASPKRNRKNMGIPDQKDLLEQKAAHECLTAMITDCKSIFSVPEEMLSKCRLSYIEQGDPVPIEDLMKKRVGSEVADHTAYMESCIQGLLRESHNKFKGWISMSSSGATDVAYKKVGDGHPLRLWKCAVDVEAPPVEVLNRIIHERHLWDEDLLKWRVVEKLDTETEVYQYVLNNMAPHPTRDFTELRSWRTNLPKGACVLVSTSVEHPEAALIGGLRAVVLASRYLIEPCGSGKSRLTHITRVDIRGHTPEWYNKAYGHLCANYVLRIRDSFKQDMESTAGPETKMETSHQNLFTVLVVFGCSLLIIICVIFCCCERYCKDSDSELTARGLPHADTPDLLIARRLREHRLREHRLREQSHGEQSLGEARPREQRIWEQRMRNQGEIDLNRGDSDARCLVENDYNDLMEACDVPVFDANVAAAAAGYRGDYPPPYSPPCALNATSQTQSHLGPLSSEQPPSYEEAMRSESGSIFIISSHDTVVR